MQEAILLHKYLQHAWDESRKINAGVNEVYAFTIDPRSSLMQQIHQAESRFQMVAKWTKTSLRGVSFDLERSV